jgi:PAS domain S-box-containing protein
MLAQASPALSGHCLFEGIVRQISEAIIFADRDGVIRVWNRGAEALFGFSAWRIQPVNAADWLNISAGVW